MPIRLCIEPGCPERAEVRGRCRAHATTKRREQRSVNNSFYASKPWRMTRRKHLHTNPLCTYMLPDGSTCDEIASDVHHVVPIEDGGPRRDPNNLRSLCHAHHTTVHRHMGKGKVPA